MMAALGNTVHGSRIDEEYWQRYYWTIVGLILIVALLANLPLAKSGDWLSYGIFLVWSSLCFAISRRRQDLARWVHGIGVIPILSLYAHLPNVSISPEQQVFFYVLFAFFPMFSLSAMLGLAGYASGLVLTVAFGLDLLARTPEIIGFVILFWGLAGAVGCIYHHLAKGLIAQYELMSRLALSDPLTGLGNRRALERDFVRYRDLASRSGKRLVLTFWDIDSLKKINDEKGHRFGDLVIKRFAKALVENARASDPFYRIGGDEFAGLHIGLDNPEQIIQRVLLNVPNCSVGWVDADNLSLEEAYQLADKKMYDHKATKA